MKKIYHELESSNGSGHKAYRHSNFAILVLQIYNMSTTYSAVEITVKVVKGMMKLEVSSVARKKF